MLKSKCVLMLTFLALVSVVFAQEERNDTWGTPRAPCMVGKRVTPIPDHLGMIEAARAVIPGDPNSDAVTGSSLVFPNSQYAAGGAGLRNRTRAHIQITGLPGSKGPMSANAAVMYWAIITTGPAPIQYYTVRLTNMQSKLTASLTGTVVGTGASPCWPGDTITVFRVLVPTGSFGPLGNMTAGDYEVNVSTGAANTYGDPWIAPSAPEWEGVSLILIAPGSGIPGDHFHNATVTIYDSGIAGTTFGGTFGDTEAYTLVLPRNSAGTGTFTNIGADGQVGVSTSAAFPQIAGEATFLNTRQVAGFPLVPGSAPDTLDSDSDWNGTIAGPLPQLWDTTTHTFGSFGSSPSMDVTFTRVKDDCVTQVANVVLIF
jgi:hypothetical protein